MNPTILGSPPYKSLGSSLDELHYHFHPDHWADLQKSNLTPETVMAARLFSSRPNQISKFIGYDHPKVTSALVFPYPGTDFVRVKVFPTILDGKGHKVKYLQPKGSGVHLYFTPNFLPRLEESKPILLVEGEKKALVADQAGHCALGIAGIYGWTKKGGMGLIDDFDLIPLRGRDVWIVPDGDFRVNPMVRAGTAGLFNQLERRGAKASIVDLNLWRQAA